MGGGGYRGPSSGELSAHLTRAVGQRDRPSSAPPPVSRRSPKTPLGAAAAPTSPILRGTRGKSYGRLARRSTPMGASCGGSRARDEPFEPWRVVGSHLVALAISSDTVGMKLPHDPTTYQRDAVPPPRAHSALYVVAVLVLVLQAVWTLEWIFIAAGNLGGPEGIAGAVVFSWMFWLIGEVILFPASLFAWAIMFVDGRRSDGAARD